MQHKNFYETVAEATIRLRGTIVLYEGDPYEVACITDHKNDGVFRIYIEPIGSGVKKMKIHTDPNIPTRNYGTDDHVTLGKKMDEYLTANPDSPVLRKYMTSPGFCKFRPYPLGMLNREGFCHYLERSPLRSTPQGLTRQMVSSTRIGLDGNFIPFTPDLHDAAFRATVKGEYPSIHECLLRLNDPAVGNEAVGFDRRFAVIRGPVGTRFLAYKADVVGVLSHGDVSKLKLSPEFAYAKEVIQDLGIFQHIEA